MARLRPGRTCRSPNSQAWARFSRSKPRKNFVRALPHTSIQLFDMGDVNGDYNMTVELLPQQMIQLRSNALEAGRLVAHKYLEASIPAAYYLKLMVYPHNVIREHKMAAGAGADRVSRGMSLAFGRPISVAARIRMGQPVFVIKSKMENRNVAVNALQRAAAKLSGTYKIVVS